jgi:hypothetical protein
MKALVAITLLALAVPTFAGGGDVKADLQAKYDAMSAAFPRQDIKPFEDALASDYVLHVGTRNTDRAKALADFKKQMANMQNAKWIRTVTHVVKLKKGYSATVKSTFDGDFDMQGKMTHFWNSGVSVDTWMEDGATGWKMKESRLVRLDATLDGKPAGHFPEKMMGHKGTKN